MKPDPVHSAIVSELQKDAMWSSYCAGPDVWINGKAVCIEPVDAVMANVLVAVFGPSSITSIGKYRITQGHPLQQSQ